MIQFRRDFAAAIDLLLRLGCPLEEALNRLSPEQVWTAAEQAKILPIRPDGQ